jgi:ABC-type transport system involved in multi-copper enzyme maturation permease subunit
MLLGLGPVLHYEIVTTARRGRFYLARVVYGLALLILLSREFGIWEQNHPTGGTPEDIHRFVEQAFLSFAAAQGIALLLLIPALVAGVIADEHQRKTLHHLLASRLSSAEIVLGKLGARLIHVATFVALGLPVVSLLSLFGGINPVHLIFVYGGTATMALCVTGISIVTSIMAQRPRDAILAAYALEAAWLFGPIAIAPFAGDIQGPLWWVGPVSECVLLSNPLVAWSELTRASPVLWRDPWLSGWILVGSLDASFYWAVAIQGAIGIAFLVLAICGLRPVRGSSWPGGEFRSGWGKRVACGFRRIVRSPAISPFLRNEILTAPSRRPPCTDEPMLWKERYTKIGRGLKWLGSPPVVLLFGVLIGCYFFDVTAPVVAGVLNGRVHDGPRMAMNGAIRFASVALGVLAMLAIASSSAVSITAEREQDTWRSLAMTLLTPAEIIRAKQLGALWSSRRIAVVLAVFWITGWLLHAVELLGVIAASAHVLFSAWFVSAAGVFISIAAKNSTRALVATFFVAFVTGMYWPAMLAGSLVSERHLGELRYALGQGWQADWQQKFSSLVAFATAAALYAGAAGILTLWSIRRLQRRWSRA